MAGFFAGETGSSFREQALSALAKVGWSRLMPGGLSGVFKEKDTGAVRAWRCGPVMDKGSPVGVWMTRPVWLTLAGQGRAGGL
jgi:hypothetical protein